MSTSTPRSRKKPGSLLRDSRTVVVPIRDGQILNPTDERSQPVAQEPARSIVPLDETLFDPDALKVVRRLVRYGYEAYFVGGGVRDLLLGRRPKDFDIATDARPEAVRALFRNSRIIGRRFRLVHVLFGQRKVIEVATFRRNPNDGSPDDNDPSPGNDELLIRSDNAFGEAHEDAARRDLTINALFYDVDQKHVIDYVGGLPDIQNRVVRTIGDPVIRFREDPVRMLRAIKFAARLDLGIEPEVYDAIVLCRESIACSARPRLLEELLKLLRSGAARRSIWLTWETGLLHVLLPELATMLDDDMSEYSRATHVWRVLGEVDRRAALRGAPLQDLVLLSLLLLEPIEEAVEANRDRAQATLDFAEPIFNRFSVPRKIADAICRMVCILPRLRAAKPGRFARSELFGVASEIIDIDQAADRFLVPRSASAGRS